MLARVCDCLPAFARVCTRLTVFARVYARVRADAHMRSAFRAHMRNRTRNIAMRRHAETCAMTFCTLTVHANADMRSTFYAGMCNGTRNFAMCTALFACVCACMRVFVRLRVFGRMRRPSQFNAIRKNQCKETASKVCPERGQREHGPCSMRASAIHRHFCTRIDEARLGGLGIPNFRNKHDEYTNPNTLGVPQTKAHECECMIVSSMRSTSQSHSKQERTTFLIGFCCGRMSFNKCAQLGTQTLQ
jgi:hypothetical protein